jgi:hypothetical protein
MAVSSRCRSRAESRRRISSVNLDGLPELTTSLPLSGLVQRSCPENVDRAINRPRGRQMVGPDRMALPDPVESGRRLDRFHTKRRL